MYHEVYLMNIPFDSTKAKTSVSALTLRPIFAGIAPLKMIQQDSDSEKYA